MIGTCSNCSYETEIEKYDNNDLCIVCAGTFFARATDQTYQYISKDVSNGEYYILRSLPTIFNALIDALNIRKEVTENIKSKIT